MYRHAERTQELASPSRMVTKTVASPSPADINRVVGVTPWLRQEVSTKVVDTVAGADGTAVDPIVAAADVPRLQTMSRVDAVGHTARRVVIIHTAHSSPTL
jgi:hypothetical protein